MSATDLVFVEELPRDGRTGDGHSPWEQVAETLRTRLGAWARVAQKPTAEAARTCAFNISRGRVMAFRPSGAFEATARRVGDDFIVYARYVGETS